MSLKSRPVSYTESTFDGLAVWWHRATRKADYWNDGRYIGRESTTKLRLRLFRWKWDLEIRTEGKPCRH